MTKRGPLGRARFQWATRRRGGQRREFSPTRSTRTSSSGFGNGFFPYVGGAIKEFFEDLKRTVAPDVISRTTDTICTRHRLVSELTWNTYRNHS